MAGCKTQSTILSSRVEMMGTSSGTRMVPYMWIPRCGSDSPLSEPHPGITLKPRSRAKLLCSRRPFYMTPQKNPHPCVGHRYGLGTDAIRHFRVKQAESCLWRRGRVGNKKLLRETSHCEATSCCQHVRRRKEAHSGSLTGVSLSVGLNQLSPFFIYYCAV